MREKTIPVVFLMLVLLIGFPSSIGNFSVFADDDDDDDDKRNNDKKEDKKESKELQKQKERAEEAREKAEQKKKELKEKYDEKIKNLEEKIKEQKEKAKEKIEQELEKAKQLKEKEKEKIEKELKKLEEKAKRLEEKDEDDDGGEIEEFEMDIDVQLSSVTGTGVTICHYPPGNPSNARTLTVGIPAAKAHMAAHGDTEGSCENIRDIDLVLEELEARFAEKKAKLEEKRVELQQKFIERAQKLVEKFEEKQAKRAEKLLEKINSGKYNNELIDEDKTLRKFVFKFESITPEPIGKQQETTSFPGTITLITSSSTDTRGTAKFKVDSCDINNEQFLCKFGKARTTSSGPSGAKDGIIIIATLTDREGFTAGLKLFLTAEESFNSLEIGDTIDKVTMHSPQSKITHQWFLEDTGTLEVTNVVSDDDT